MAFDTHGATGKPWTGFDLDGTLATYDKWRGVAHVGDPVKPMCDLIKELHADGKDVKIVTARVAPRENGLHLLAHAFIARWCKDNLGFIPPITHKKDALMEILYDDRVKAVEQNTGKVLNMTKFKVGDEVRVVNPHIADRGRYGKVVSAGVDGNPLLYDVELGGGVQLFSESDLVAANAARSTNSIVAKALNAARARNANFPVEKFEVGKIYRAPWDKNWVAKVLSRTDSSIKVAIKSARNAKDGFGAEVKVGDTVKFITGTWRGLVGKVKKIDGAKATVRTEEEGDVTEDLKLVRVWNSRACNSCRSTNAVVAKALNALKARNAVALNWNFKNSYQFFCVDPSLKAPCILSGWDYREDAKDDAAELKEVGIPHKIVSRRFLEQQGIDPNAESSWKKNRR